jgi:outer membrane protein TolC
MKKLFAVGYILWLCLLSSQRVSAQNDTLKKPDNNFIVSDETQSIGTYNLQQCIAYALQYAESLKKQQYQIQISEQEVKERLATGLPEVKAQARVTNNLRIPSIFIPDGRSFNPNLPPGPVGIQLQTQFGGDASVNVEQLLFDFSYFMGLKAARTYTDLAKHQLNLSKIDIAERVTKAYYGVLINQARLDLVRLDFYRLDTLLKYTQALQKNGLVEKIDVMRAEVALNNTVTLRQKTEKVQELTLQILKYQMGMNIRDSIILEGNISAVELTSDDNMETEPNYKSRLEYILLETNTQLQAINYKYNKSNYYPRFYAFGTAGANTGQNEFGEVWRFRNNWYKYFNVGASMSWTIFDGWKRRHTLQKVRLEMLKIEEDKKILKKNVDWEVAQARSNLITSLKDLEIQKRNMELAREVSNLSLIKYKNGVGTNVEFINAEAAYKEAELNYFTALYNAVVSKVDIDKAMGRLLKTD